ncbi:tRNA glutamyl-Q(34) synthetase GluQRS [Flavimaricola marinus]|uniref:Glutamyl-Q tRNA(Asp) synthetase n=1 Tax=Flavimaricola marinus TaxID=1819565 RepID=A0A238LCX9_9RHOB|nr:tRNA glutamyl-Q(34) synthetase GluQRS [Flavimaricola marinus]SMY07471.1 Glutamyl-Q tRNA(Asp) synthetase [Flavimaricola marinus]
MITRFAPSPTGPLHLGHAYSALLASDMAREEGGALLLRIEDIDQSRSRPEWERQIEDDLHWLGINWPTPVLRQSDRIPAYRSALELLWERGLLYPCTCTRRDIYEAASAPQEGARTGPDGVIYPGTCRGKARTGPLPDGAMRLDMSRALNGLESIEFQDTGAQNPGNHNVSAISMLETVGDIVVARRDFGTSYHLSVVVDDAFQNITHVVRGADLFEATQIHVLLQTLLGYPTPVYHHHRLIRDENGRRLAKRDDARALSLYRREGLTPQNIRALVGL